MTKRRKCLRRGKEKEQGWGLAENLKDVIRWKNLGKVKTGFTTKDSVIQTHLSVVNGLVKCRMINRKRQEERREERRWYNTKIKRENMQSWRKQRDV